MKLLKYLKMVLADERGIFGLFESDAPTPFKINDKQAASDIQRLRDFSQSEITGPSKGAQIALDDLGLRKEKALQGAAQAGAASSATQLSNLGIFGGAGGGAGERIGRSTANRQQLGDQQLRSDFSSQHAGLLAGDLQNEQARRDQQGQQALQGELGLIGARTSAELGNRAALAQNKASNKATGAALGTALGSAFGPVGGALGGVFGSALS